MPIQTEQPGILADDMHAERVESAHEWPLIHGDRSIQALILREQSQDSLSHLACGLIRKSYGQNGMRSYTLFDKIEDSMRYDARLAGAGSGYDQDRALGCLDCSLLFRIVIHIIEY